MKKWLMTTLAVVMAAAGMVAVGPAAPAWAWTNAGACQWEIRDPHISSTYLAKGISTVDGKGYIRCKKTQTVKMQVELVRCAKKFPSWVTEGSAAWYTYYGCRYMYKTALISKTATGASSGYGPYRFWVTPDNGNWDNGLGKGWWRVKMNRGVMSGHEVKNKWGPWSTTVLNGKGRL